MSLFRNYIILNATQRRVIAVLAVVLSMTGTRVQAAQAHEVLPNAPAWETGSVEQNDHMDRGIVVPKTFNGSLPEASDSPALRIAFARVTAYTSVPGETDSTPFITADGSDVRNVPNVVATNCLKFGTKIRIPEKFGDRIFVVHDRMNARYTNCSATELDHVDIWINAHELDRTGRLAKAREVGNSRLEIQILK